MKKLFTLILLIFVYSGLLAQKTFDSGLLSFTYPSYFKNSPINNAPHMMLKLESDKYFFSISSWDYGIDESVDAWDDSIYKSYKGFSPGESKFISIEKALLYTKTGEEHCLKIKTNSCKNEVKLRTLFYLIIKNGYLFTFAFLSDGQYTVKTPTTYTDNIMKGLAFKNMRKDKISTTPPQEIKDKLKDIYMSFCKELNSQTPLYVDEITTLNSAVFIDWTMMFTYKVAIDANDFAETELKLMMNTMREYGKNNAKDLLRRGSYNLNNNDFMQLMKAVGLRFRMTYIDINNVPMGSIVYDYKDFSEYKEHK